MTRLDCMSAEITELFEDILDKHNVMIPDEDRNGDEGEACLYGMTYWDLTEDINEVILERLERLAQDFDSQIAEITNKKESGDTPPRRVSDLDAKYAFADDARKAIRTTIWLLKDVE